MYPAAKLFLFLEPELDKRTLTITNAGVASCWKFPCHFSDWLIFFYVCSDWLQLLF